MSEPGKRSSMPPRRPSFPQLAARWLLQESQALLPLIHRTTIATVIIGALVFATIRVGWQSRREIGRANAAPALDERITHAARALRLWLPFAPWPKEAVHMLREIGEDPSRDAALRMRALTELRSGISTLRGLWQPFARELHEDEKTLARLIAAETGSSDIARIERELRKDESARLPFAIAAIVALAALIGSAFSFATRAIDEDGRVRTRTALWLGAAMAGSLALLLVALALA